MVFITRKIKAYPFWGIILRHKRTYLSGVVALIFVDAINVALPLVVKQAVDAVALKKIPTLYLGAGAYLLLMLLQSVGRYLWRIYLIGTCHLIAKELRVELYGHLQRLPLQYYQKIRTGDLMSRSTNDIESVRTALGPGILVALDAVLMFVMIVPVMLLQSVKLSLLAFVFYPLVPFITAYFGKKIDLFFTSLQVRLSALSAYAQETVGGIRLIKSLTLESHVAARFRELSQDYKDAGMDLSKYEAVFSPTLSLITNLGTLFILFFGGVDTLNGLITLGTFVAFQRFVTQLAWPMEAIGWAVTMNQEGIAAYRRLSEVFEVPKVVEAFPVASSSKSSDAVLEIKELKYSREEEGSGGFHLFIPSLRVKKGEKIGIVGQIGSGKTTLFNLIVRLYEPGRASIFFEGQDVSSIPLLSLRNQIASVEQQIYLFSETIRLNVGMGMDNAPEEGSIAQLAEVANFGEELRAFEKGMDATLGERGINLSGGQKQRVALLRALVRNPKLLLLDDAFSAVDVGVESQIIDRFFKYYPDLTVLFASHRLSVMTRMDRIVLMERGQVQDIGSHEELLSRSALYQELWKKNLQQKSS